MTAARESAPRPGAVRRRPDDAMVARLRRAAVPGAVGTITAAEVLVAAAGAVPGALLHGLLLLGLLTGWVLAGDGALLVLALLPLGRVTSLALTLDDTGAGAYLLSGLPLLVAVGWLLRELRRRGGLPWRWQPWPGAAVALAGVPLGWLVHQLVPAPARDGTPVLLTALAAFLVAGVLEEVLYRGLVQRVLTARAGAAGVLLADLLFAAAYLPTGEPLLVAVMALLGLGAGWYVRRTGDLVAVALAHGLLAAGFLAVWPVLG